MDYVHRRGSTFYAVIPVPSELQPVIGKRQIWRSLRTSRYNVARSEARKLILCVEVLFQKLREPMDKKLIDAMVAEYGLECVAEHDKARKGIPASPDVTLSATMEELYTVIQSSYDAHAKAVSVLSGVAGEYQRLIGRGKYKEVPFAEEFARLYISRYRHNGMIGPDEDLDPDDLKEAVASFADAEKLLHKIESERLQGITEEESAFQDKLLSKWRANLPVRKDYGIPVSELFKRYGEKWANERADKQARVTRKLRELKKLERVFVEAFGTTPRIKEVTPEMALEWREHYQYEYDEEVLANKTVKNALETLSAVFNFAVNEKLLEANPFRGLTLPEGQLSEKSRIFESSELQAYIDLLAELSDPLRPEATWLPLIMMFSGMRCNEVAQLFVDDIQTKEGITYFRITDNQERNQSIKSEESRRNVPVHKWLIEAGLLRHVEEMKKQGQAQVFPNCRYRPTEGLYYDCNMSSRFNEAVNLIAADKKLRLYSLRANFRCSIEEALMQPAIDAIDRGEMVAGGGISKFHELAIDNIMGHKVKGNTGDAVYRKKQISIMNSVVQLAKYPVDFRPVLGALG